MSSQQQSQHDDNEWTTHTTRNTTRRRGDNRRPRQPRGQGEGRSSSSSSSINAATGRLSSAMSTMKLQQDNGNVEDDDTISVKQVQAALQVCQQELQQTDFYKTLLQLQLLTTQEQGFGNNDDNSSSGMVVEEIVCYGIGNFYSKRPSSSAPLWQLALVLLLRDYHQDQLLEQKQQQGEQQHVRAEDGMSTADTAAAATDVVWIRYFEPRMTTKERDFLENHLQHVHVIADNERGCRSIFNKDSNNNNNQTARKILFFMPHCPRMLYANVLYTNWNYLNKLLILGNSLSNYLDNHGNRTTQAIKKRSRHHYSNNNNNPLYKKQNPSHGTGNATHHHHNQKLSRALSWALRHNAHKIGLPIHEDGYVPVQEILDCRHSKIASAKPTVEAIQEMVQQNDKQRFKLDYRPRRLFYPNNDDGDNGKGKGDDDDEATILCLRANQGHSMSFINPELLLRQLSTEELRSTPCIVHGTYLDAWTSIQKQGLSKRNRTHIHFASGVPDDPDHYVISGMRKSATVYIYVDAVKCCAAEDKEGRTTITFYQSDNGVLLSDGIDGILPTKYFSHVVEASTGTILLDNRRRSDGVLTNVDTDTTTAAEKDCDEGLSSKPGVANVSGPSPTSEESNNNDPPAVVASPLDILQLLQPYWEENRIRIGKKDVSNCSGKFEEAFNDTSLTTFVAVPPDALRPLRMESDASDSSEVL